MQNGIQIYKQTIYGLNPKVTEEEWEYFESGFTVEQYKANTFFIEADKKNHRLGFANGLVRGYYINDLGQDITTTFVTERAWGY